MRYRIYLTDASDEAKNKVAAKFTMCPCCNMAGTIWLSASDLPGKTVIHGEGYYDEENHFPPTDYYSSEEVCRYCVKDELTHGRTVILTPDADTFISLVDKYFLKDGKVSQKANLKE